MSIRRASPTRAATATITGRPFSAATGSRSSASRASRYSGSTPAPASSARAASIPAASDPSRAPLLGRPQGPRERDGPLAVLVAEVGVARAHRQAVGLAHGRHRPDPHREVEVAGHAPDHRDLLRVLLAEVGDVGLNGVEELGDHRGDAAEVLRPAPRRVAAEHLGQALDLDVGGEAVRVDLFDRRRVDEVDARLRRRAGRRAASSRG